MFCSVTSLHGLRTSIKSVIEITCGCVRKFTSTPYWFLAVCMESPSGGIPLACDGRRRNVHPDAGTLNRIPNQTKPNRNNWAAAKCWLFHYFEWKTKPRPIGGISNIFIFNLKASIISHSFYSVTIRYLKISGCPSNYHLLPASYSYGVTCCAPVHRYQGLQRRQRTRANWANEHGRPRSCWAGVFLATNNSVGF